MRNNHLKTKICKAIQRGASESATEFQCFQISQAPKMFPVWDLVVGIFGLIWAGYFQLSFVSIYVIYKQNEKDKKSI